MLKIRRALISVWDKQGVIDLVKKLLSFNIEIISTGKTASLLRKSGAKVKEVSKITSFPEILSGRVKTLHPKIFGAILANKKHPLHLDEIKNLEIEPIDMVVVNFYPFDKMAKENIGFGQMLEYIDIGGPSLLRAGAKNFKNVACVSSPRQYKKVIEEINKNKGCVSEEALHELAGEVFRVTKEYDTAIYSYLKGGEVLTWNLEKTMGLRYGENPHQKGALFKLIDRNPFAFKQLQGKKISFNNLLDLDAALSVVQDFSEPAAVVVKHASPCGVACDKNISKAYVKAYRCDPLSSFGGVIGLNRKVDKKTASEIIKSGFKECVVAPAYSKESIRQFQEKKNLRVIETSFVKRTDLKDIKRTAFGYLIQDHDSIDYDKTKLKVVTIKNPSPKEWKDLLFAWKIVKFVKSNAVVVVKNVSLLGTGGGQPSRVDAVKLALKKSAKSIHGAVVASDAFFPKEDSIKLLHAKAVKAIIQPGGSIADEKIIQLCNKYRIAMVFTGIRHFHH
ncbi:MAG: bifunctional phosphoribosylaminoimidazolecarboxamide formyltransferase/IMP cyclohydrolase [Candidatus Omnitrophota bacterium]